MPIQGERNNGASKLNRRVLMALIWLLVFTGWFHSFGLPNHRPAMRWQVWGALPFDLLDLVDPPVDPQAAPWSWAFLLQRLPFVWDAGLMWLGAWGLGALALRGLRLREAFDSLERFFFAMVVGLSALSLIILSFGLLGWMDWRLMLAVLSIAPALEKSRAIASSPAVRASVHLVASDNKRCRESFQQNVPAKQSSLWLMYAIVLPFVFCLLLGAMSPQTDFDVVEYHLGGPKEWFQAGRITRLPHNVYTSFPFLTEMILLGGMILRGDWESGALSGQAALAGFTLLTAVGLYAMGRRWFGPLAGAMAAVIWLTTPWAYRISIIAYAEGGLACYLFAAFAVGLRLVWGSQKPEARSQNVPLVTSVPSATNDQSATSIGTTPVIRLTILCGLLSGSAMACKYTGAVSVVLPLAVMIVMAAMKSHVARADKLRAVLIQLTLFGLGVFVTVGPWLAKNCIETGNPVYPLAYGTFGGEGRDAQLDAKFRAGHPAKMMSYPTVGSLLSDMIVKLTDVAANNDWHSALMFGFAPIVLLASWRRRVWTVWAFVAWQFLSWFLFTHHIDRFYVPMFPCVALMAGAGAAWLFQAVRTEGVDKSIAGIALWAGRLVVFSNLLFNAWIMLKVSGFNAGRTDLAFSRHNVVSQVWPAIEWINNEQSAGRLPSEMKVLCVGEAALFHARFAYAYSTVFDRNLFEEWLSERSDDGSLRLRPTDQIRDELNRRGVTHILVNWSEVLRYREPGSYGYSEFVHPDRFEELVRSGLIEPIPLPDEIGRQALSGSRLVDVNSWAPTLRTTYEKQPALISQQFFRVRPTK